MIDRSGYYSLRAILGYGCKYNIILSDRGRGKSFDAKHFLMRQPGTAMCLYRQSTDMHMAMMSWIDPLINKDKDLEKYELYDPESFEWIGSDKEGYVLKFNGQPKIWFRYLTQVNHIKQEVFPDDMNWVWLDEFIPLQYKKLPGVDSEGDAIRAIVKTIEHDTQKTRKDKGLKEVRVILFANPFTWNNPILSYFKLRPIEGGGIKKIGPGVVLEMLPPVEKKKKGKMTADDFLGNEVNVNQGWKDEMAYIEVNWTTDMIPAMSLRLGSKYFMLWQKQGHYTLYCSSIDKHRNTAGLCTYDRWGTQDGLMEDETCINNTSFLKNLKERVRRGQIYYKDMNCKFDFQNELTTIN